MKNLKHDHHLCEDCLFKISLYGYPCVLLMDLACNYFMEGKKLTYREDDPHDKIFKVPLNFLEGKGFLLSTEINDQIVQIMPNLTKDAFDPHRNHFCWC